MGARFRVSSERLEKPGIKPKTPGLEGGQLNHYATEASKTTATTSQSQKRSYVWMKDSCRFKMTSLGFANFVYCISTDTK